MQGVALLHTLQNLGLFGLYDTTVRGDVVERPGTRFKRDSWVSGRVR